MTGFHNRAVPRVLGWVRWLGPVCTALCALFAIGCAHAHLEVFHCCTGKKVCDVESWVLGTGETEQVTNACGDYAYATRDTGISDNGKESLGTIAEGAARGLVPTP
jgi:hypothetical protein